MMKALLAAAGILLAAVLAEGRRELGFFKIRRYRLSLPQLKDLDSEKRVILLADLHNKVYGEDNEELFRSVRRERPDIILIAGDMIIGKKELCCKEAMEFVSRLTSVCPVYYSLGNHEQRMKENTGTQEGEAFRTYQDKLKKAGVCFLENDGAECMLDRLKVQLHGLELPMPTYEKFKRHMVTAEDIRKCIGQADGACFQLLMAHNPVFFPAYKAWGADLTVSGHLHGGIVRIPGLGGMITPQATLFPKYSGEMTVEGNQAIVVSKGLGTHTINFRFCNHAEVVVIHLLPYSEGAENSLRSVKVWEYQ